MFYDSFTQLLILRIDRYNIMVSKYYIYLLVLFVQYDRKPFLLDEFLDFRFNKKKNGGHWLQN